MKSIMKTTNLIGCCMIVAMVSAQLRGAEKTLSRVDAGESRVFNVLNYGAVGDDKTDNTRAFSACLKAVIEAGGGRMYLPAGVYRGRITIPAVAPNRWMALEIVGESQPATVFGTVGRFELHNNNTIVKSLATSGPAVVSAVRWPGDFSYVHVVLKDLEVRTYDNPGIDGIDLEWAVQCRVENVFIDTGVYSVQAAKPTHGAKGLITPACNNGALTLLRNVVVTGFDTGIVVNEHTDADNINLGSNIHGLSFPFAHHASRFGRICAALHQLAHGDGPSRLHDRATRHRTCRSRADGSQQRLAGDRQ